MQLKQCRLEIFSIKNKKEDIVPGDGAIVRSFTDTEVPKIINISLSSSARE